MKLDPRFTLGLGIGLILSSSLFLIFGVFPLGQQENGSYSQGINDLEEMDENSNQDFEDLFENNETDHLEANGNLSPEGIADPSEEIYEKTVKIPEGLSAEEIAELLEKYEVVEDSRKLIDTLIQSDSVTKLKHGTFDFSDDLSTEQVAEKLVRGP